MLLKWVGATMLHKRARDALKMALMGRVKRDFIHTLNGMRWRAQIWKHDKLKQKRVANYRTLVTLKRWRVISTSEKNKNSAFALVKKQEPHLTLQAGWRGWRYVRRLFRERRLGKREENAMTMHSRSLMRYALNRVNESSDCI